MIICVFELQRLLIKKGETAPGPYPSCDFLTTKTQSPPSHHEMDVFLLLNFFLIWQRILIQQL